MGFIKVQAIGKLFSCEDNFALMVWPSSDSFSYKEVQL